MKNKKILFLVTQSEFGGAQHFIYTLVTALRRSTQIKSRQVGNTQIHADIVVTAGPEGDDENGLLFALEKIGIKTKHLKYLRRSINPFFDFCLGLIEIYRLIKKEKPDILFLCSSKAGAMGSLVGRITGVKKIIYRIGGWTFNDPRCFLINWYYIFIEKVSAKWKDYIINNAESDRKQAIEIGIKPRKKILVIYNGIGDLEFLSKEKAREFLELNLPAGKAGDSEFVVGTIANDYPTKGLKYLKKAMENIDGKLVIIGKGNRYIPDAYKYLKAFDVFVLPSVKEGFPWTILEAIKAEIPIVATGVGAVPEIIDEYIKPRNVQDLIKAIRAPKKFEFNEKFSLETMVQQYENLFSLN